MAQVWYNSTNEGVGKVWKGCLDLGLQDQMKEEWNIYILGIEELLFWYVF